MRRGDWLLSDGAYADLVPIDVAKSFGNPVVIAVNANQALVRSEIRTGFQALTRAVDSCQLSHAHVRFEEADLTLRPAFRRPIDTLDFGAKKPLGIEKSTRAGPSADLASLGAGSTSESGRKRRL